MDIIDWRITTLALAMLVASKAAAQEIETFVEPYRAAALSTTETGVLEQIVVEDGSRVQIGQTLAWLNDDVLHASLKVADAGRQAKAALKIAVNSYLLTLTNSLYLLSIYMSGLLITG